MMSARWQLRLLVGCVGMLCVTAAQAHEDHCHAQPFTSTFEAIETVIFQNRGCTLSGCHNASVAPHFLDLRPGHAYDNLIGKPSQSVEGWERVRQGEKERSLLFINLAAAVDPETYTAPLRPMPSGLPPISSDELAALRKWIEAGADRDAAVPGTDELLDACLPPPKPVEIDPLPPPAPGTGVQIHMPRWILAKHSEAEVCYASYYDVTDQVPAEFRGPNGTFRYNFHQIRQDPLSHHLIVNLYNGTSAPTAPIWGAFKCRGGPKDGETCNPLDIGFCGASPEAGQGECANEPMESIACFGQPNLPADAGTGLNSNGFTGTQETATTIDLADGVYAEVPLKGMIIWNSHAFNLTDQDGKLEAWLNFEFAPPAEQVYPLRGVFNTDEIFSMNVPPFQAQELCHVHVLPPHAQITELSSHMHQRGKRFRTFDGAWRCRGGAHDGEACSPLGPDLTSGAADICAGAPCESRLPPAGGDCSGDLIVTINELVTSVNIALGSAPVSACPRADSDENGRVTVDEVIKGVSAAAAGGMRNPDQSLLYVSVVYNDPVVRRLAPPMSVGGTASVPEERSLTFCALYDNGFADPSTVKRQSTSPPTPIGVPDLFGGPCAKPVACTAGAVGAACSGTTPAQRDATCDTTPGAGDGDCDACPLRGGVTTEDEMFILIGSYFINR